MPKAKTKKKTDVKASMTKSVFMHGQPNRAKFDMLKSIQNQYTSAVRGFVVLLNGSDELLLQLLLNKKKDSAMRAFEKAHRVQNLGSAYSQNAFDDAVTMLHNRLAAIEGDVFAETRSVLASVKTLYYCVLTGKSRQDMLTMLVNIRDSYKSEDKIKQYQNLIDQLTAMSDTQFDAQYKAVKDKSAELSSGYKVPDVKKSYVRLDSRLCTLKPAITAKSQYVLAITVPKGLKKGDANSNSRMEIPVYTSANSLRRLAQYGVSSSMSFTIRKGGKLRLAVPFEKTTSLADKTDDSKTIGVDVGITDAFHTSDDRAICSFSEDISFYKKEAEPLLGQISSMRNKKRTLKHYLKVHKKTLEPDVVMLLRRKIDRIECAIQHAKKAYHKVNQYHNMVAHTARTAVDTYIKSLGGDKTVLTAIELLDIKEFNKSRRQNGRYSMFARGMLSSKLIESLNWHGYQFVQVDPAYTSQTCPICSNQNPANRNQKVFFCTCCGYSADADHVGGINIKARATDAKIQKICEDHKYSTEERHKALRELLAARNAAWKEANPDKILPQKEEASEEESSVEGQPAKAVAV